MEIKARGRLPSPRGGGQWKVTRLRLAAGKENRARRRQGSTHTRDSTPAFIQTYTLHLYSTLDFEQKESIFALLKPPPLTPAAWGNAVLTGVGAPNTRERHYGPTKRQHRVPLGCLLSPLEKRTNFEAGFPPRRTASDGYFSKGPEVALSRAH